MAVRGHVWAFKRLFYPCKPATVGETEVRSARWPAKGRVARREPRLPLEQLQLTAGHPSCP